jgi:hypothetical protein
MARGGSIGWQEAVARLAGERTRAEAYAGLVKKHGDEVAISSTTVAYGEAKAEVDAVIAGLTAALAQGQQPKSLPDLEARLERGVKAREAFSAQVMALVPKSSGDKSVVTDLAGVGGVITSLFEAVKELAFRWAERDELTRKTIQSQLEATKWLEFAAVPPAT